MRAEFVNEKVFKQGQEPYKSLGIGLLSMSDVKTGDIIKSKMEFSIKAINREIGPSYVIGEKYPGDTYFYVVNATPQRNGYIGMHLEPCGSLKHAKEVKAGVIDVFRGPTVHTWGPPDHWDWYFEPLQRSQY
jgi:hypothetical protein